MSRFGEGDGDEDFPNAWALSEKRAQLALEGRRGKAALRDLRAALEALPVKRLIAGAVCTVGLRERVAAMPARIPGKVWDRTIEEFVDGFVDNEERDDLLVFLERHVDEEEGVCAMGAAVWHHKVKAGMDPDAAFAALPVIPDTEYGSASDTARLGRDELGLAYSLAWTIAEQNDGEYGFGNLTPEERYVAFIGWIDEELAKPPLTRPTPKPKRERRRTIAGAALTSMRRPPADAPRLGL